MYKTNLYWKKGQQFSAIGDFRRVSRLQCYEMWRRSSGRLLSTFRVNPCFHIQGRKVSCCCTTVQTGKSTSVQKVIFTCSVLCVSDHSYKSVQKVQTQVSVLLPSFIGPLPRFLWFLHSSFARSVPIVYSPSWIVLLCDKVHSADFSTLTECRIRVVSNVSSCFGCPILELAWKKLRCFERA